MKFRVSKIVWLLLLVVAVNIMFSACGSPMTPSEVTKADDDFVCSYENHVLTVTGTGALLGAHRFNNGENYDRDDVHQIIIKKGCTEIGPGVFFGLTNVSSITLPDGLTKLANEVFNSSELTSIVIPSTVVEISGNPFTSCEKLTSITNESPHFIVEDGVLFSKDKTTLVCCPASMSGTYSIPNSVKIIGPMAFVGCKSLKEVIVPNTVTEIGEYAFSDCEEIVSLIIPTSVKSIGKNAFWWIDRVYYGGSANGTPWGAKGVSPYTLDMFG